MSYRIICHGGASRVRETSKEKQEVVQFASDIGARVMKEGGSAVDAVVEAISSMENSPLCNAGTGSFLQMDGQVRMDACLMDQDLRVGAVIQISDVKNPIRVARTLLKQGANSILAGEHATQFARITGHSSWDPRTENRVTFWMSQWQKFQNTDPAKILRQVRAELADELQLGTVGAVAQDESGKLAAGTSTGGLKLVMPGRVGDVPLVGCGTYCNQVAGVSCTGTGEKIIRAVLAKTVCGALEFGMNLDQALDLGMERMEQVRGWAGLIMITQDGQISSRHNTQAMVTAVREEA
jgi:L-asparaginase / beta-aspartyl-peptidase